MKIKKSITLFAFITLFTIITSSAALAAWQQDSTGKRYQNEDGSYPLNAWQQIDGSWYHFNENGYMQTGFATIGNHMYYFAPDTGIMESGTTRQIDDFAYTFDSNGCLLYQTDNAEASAGHTLERGSWDGLIYTNQWADYQIALPEDFSVKYMNSDVVKMAHSVDFVIGSADGMNFLTIYFVNVPSNPYSPEQLLEAYSQKIVANVSGSTKSAVVDKELGGYTYKYVSCCKNNNAYTDLYCRIVDGKYMYVDISYTNSNIANNLIGTMRKAN